jgi:transcriptional regulator with XRE-family HTH domain
MPNSKDALTTNPDALARAKVARILGRRLRYLRGQIGVTQQAIAESIGWSDHSYLSKLERGELLPRLTTLVKLANYFGVDVSTLLSDKSTLEQGKANRSL